MTREEIIAYIAAGCASTSAGIVSVFMKNRRHRTGMENTMFATREAIDELKGLVTSKLDNFEDRVTAVEDTQSTILNLVSNVATRQDLHDLRKDLHDLTLRIDNVILRRQLGTDKRGG